MKVAVKVILLSVLAVIGIISDSMAPVITNSLAMAQMENSDALLVATNTFNRIKPVIDILYAGLIIVVIGSIANDLHTMFKKEKEN